MWKSSPVGNDPVVSYTRFKMNADHIDTVILHVASFLSNNTLEEVHQGMLSAGFTEEEIFLLVKAAQIIRADRDAAPPPPAPIVKRVV
jgi:hypothetical protein